MRLCAVKLIRSCLMARKFSLHMRATQQTIRSGAPTSTTLRNTMVRRLLKAKHLRDPVSAVWMATQASASQSSARRTSLRGPQRSNFYSASRSVTRWIEAIFGQCAKSAAWQKRRNGLRQPTGTSRFTIGLTSIHQTRL